MSVRPLPKVREDSGPKGSQVAAYTTELLITPKKESPK